MISLPIMYTRFVLSHTLIAAITLIIFGAFVVFAWTGPSSSPPNGNVDAPINVGGTDQVKDAGLALNALAVFGESSMTGNVTAAGFFHSSDARLKTNIRPIGGLDLVSKLRGVSFEWKGDGSASAGVIAQEVEAVLPEAVRTDAQGMKSVDYAALIAPIIQAINEQQEEIELLKREVEIFKQGVQ